MLELLGVKLSYICNGASHKATTHGTKAAACRPEIAAFSFGGCSLHVTIELLLMLFLSLLSPSIFFELQLIAL